MTAGVVSPVVPSLATGQVPARLPGLSRRPPLPALSRPRERSTLYGLATPDDRGRVADRLVIRALGWACGTRLDIRAVGGLVLVRADQDGLFAVTSQGYVRLAAVVRHRCHLAAGDRVLLAADPTQGLLVVYPPAALDALVDQLYAAVLGDDAP